MSVLRSRLVWIAREYVPSGLSLFSPRSFSGSMHLPYENVTEDLKTPAKPQTSPAVFEEPSEDYSTVLSRYPPAPPTIAEILQQKLPAILPDYVAGTSIFEEETSDYALSRLSTGTPDVGNSSTQTLFSLLAKKQFRAASTLLADMQYLNSSIPPSAQFKKAALSVLRSGLPAEEKLDQFTKWFALIPPSHDRASRSDFWELRYMLLQDSSANLPLLERTALILSSKGFGNTTMMQFLSPLFTNLPPDHLGPLILDLERRNWEYWEEYDPSKAKLRDIFVSENVRGLAVQCLVYSNRIDEAIAMLPKGDTPYGYSTQTYNILLEKLHRSPDSRYRQLIPHVKRLREARTRFTISRGTSAGRPGVKSAAPVTPEDTSPVLPPPPGSTLPQMLCYLRTHLARPDPHRILPTVLSSFMVDYNSHTPGRTDAPRLLLARALRTSRRATKRVVWSEMRFYRDCNRPDMVVRTFVEHFFTDGVPRARVLQVYANVLLGTYDENVSRISGFEQNSILPQGKLFPDLEQCAMVWEALVLLTMREPKRREEAMEGLYSKLIAYARSGAEYQPSPTPPAPLPAPEHRHISSGSVVGAGEPAQTNHISPGSAGTLYIPRPTRFGVSVSPATFHTFLQHGLRVLGPEWGERVVEDMRSIGLWPGAYHWGALARAWAERGRQKLRMSRHMAAGGTQEMSEWVREGVARVWRIVDAVESGKVIDWAMAGGKDGDLATKTKESTTGHATTPADPSNTLSAPQRPPSDSQTPVHMRPDLGFYLTIMHGFLYAKDVENAEAIAARLVRRLGTEAPSRDAGVVRALQKLEDLKALLEQEGAQTNALGKHAVSAKVSDPKTEVCAGRLIIFSFSSSNVLTFISAALFA